MNLKEIICRDSREDERFVHRKDVGGFSVVCDLRKNPCFYLRKNHLYEKLGSILWMIGSIKLIIESDEIG